MIKEKETLKVLNLVCNINGENVTVGTTETHIAPPSEEIPKVQLRQEVVVGGEELELALSGMQYIDFSDFLLLFELASEEETTFFVYESSKKVIKYYDNDNNKPYIELLPTEGYVDFQKLVASRLA